MIKLFIDPTVRSFAGRLKYNLEDLAFGFDMEVSELSRFNKLDVSSVVIDTLQIEVEINSGTALYVWGFYPLGGAKLRSLPIPDSIKCGMKLQFEENLTLGVSKQIAPYGEWNSFYDAENGWICIGNYETSIYDVAIEFAENTVAAIKGDELIALWLKPLRE